MAAAVEVAAQQLPVPAQVVSFVLDCFRLSFLVSYVKLGFAFWLDIGRKRFCDAVLSHSAFLSGARLSVLPGHKQARSS